MTTARSARTKGLITYPNKIGKILGKWYYGKSSSIVRSRSSGLYGKKNVHHRGDLEVDLEFAKTKRFRRRGDFPFCVELKHDKSWTFKELWKNRSQGFLFDAFLQAFEDSLDKKGKVSKYPMVVFTKNYEFNYIIYPISMCDGSGCEFYNDEIVTVSQIYPSLELGWEYEYTDTISNIVVQVMRLDHFIDEFTYENGWELNLAEWKSL